MTEPSSKRRKHSHDVSGTDESTVVEDLVEIAVSDTSEPHHEFANGTAVVSNVTDASTHAAQPLSKNQLKKLRKREEWEAGRDFRRAKRKEKTQERKIRKRQQKQQAAKEREANGLEATPNDNTRQQKPVRLPIAFIIDCGFDDKMVDKERISLGSQLTRSYSDNYKAPFQAHLYVSSWNGHLKHRFDTVLHEHYKNWKGIEFTSEDFMDAAKAAEETMKATNGDELAGFFAKFTSQTSELPKQGEDDDNQADPSPQVVIPPIDDLKSQGEVIYLTSDSPNILTELKPFSTYIIGGLVDKNRHKGICYKIAGDRGVKTAKLPIGQYMEMQSRFVLATNHVNEIMLRFLECGDWGEAFMRVIPKRKGGKLKGDKQTGGVQENDDSHEQDANDDESGNDPNSHDDDDVPSGEPPTGTEL